MTIRVVGGDSLIEYCHKCKIVHAIDDCVDGYLCSIAKEVAYLRKRIKELEEERDDLRSQLVAMEKAADKAGKCLEKQYKRIKELETACSKALEWLEGDWVAPAEAKKILKAAKEQGLWM